MKRIVCAIGLLAMVLSLLGSCQQDSNEKIDLLVLNAGSLVIPFAQMEKEYESLHPEIDLRFEGHGSIQVVRHTTEIGDPASVAVVADYSLLPILMYQAKMPDGTPYADWHIRFATNRLGVAFTPESRYAAEINSDNWYDILLRPDVNLGISDPRLDAVGYRSLMLIRLAEDYYGAEDLFYELVTSNFNAPIRGQKDGSGYLITVPELLEAKSSRIYLRGFSVQLLSLLEAHQIDYAFEYESVARQHGLEFVPLPEEIDLSAEALAADYAKVVVTLDYRRYKTVTPVFQGLPIIYGVTIPRSAPHPEEAMEFLQFLLGHDGQRILRENFQPPLVPAEADYAGQVPPGLRDIIRQ
jgi:molybdate/tungstate transport system substrate-binding protein